MRTVKWLLAWMLAISHPASPDGAYFSITSQHGTHWFRTPEGKLLFSNGVNVVDDTKALEQLREWRFNTIGAWSDSKLYYHGTPFTVQLHLGSSLGFPWNDLFHPDFARAAVDIAKTAVAKYRNDNNLIGYFVDNELGWWGSAIFLHHLHQSPGSFTRQRLIALLREQYQNRFVDLQRDFETPGIVDWKQLESADKPEIWLRPGSGGMKVISRFLGIVADQYYKVVSNAIRRVDPGHLLLGGRYAGYYDPAVVQAASRYMDVVSSNYAADFLDGSLSRYYLDTLHKIAGKPLLVSEYYFCATENRTGNLNPGAIYPVVGTQRERAKAFRKNLESLASLPYIVGAHWFQYRDEPKGGRPQDGEDYNMGLVDIIGRPYEMLTAAAAGVDVDKAHRTDTKQQMEQPVIDLPAPPPDPWAGLTGWPRNRAFVLTRSDNPFCRSLHLQRQGQRLAGSYVQGRYGAETLSR